MIRKTLTFLSLVGLLLSVGAWGLSHYDIGYSVFNPKWRTCSGVELTRGGIEWFDGGPGGSPTNKPSDFELGWHASDFDFYPKWRLDYGDVGIRWLFVPLWIPALLSATALGTCRMLYRRRVGPGLNMEYSQDQCDRDFHFSSVRDRSIARCSRIIYVLSIPALAAAFGLAGSFAVEYLSPILFKATSLSLAASGLGWFVGGVPGAILGLILLARYETRQERQRCGQCRRCGYDLRGSKDRCPECGTGFSK